MFWVASPIPAIDSADAVVNTLNEGPGRETFRTKADFLAVDPIVALRTASVGVADPSAVVLYFVGFVRGLARASLRGESWGAPPGAECRAVSPAEG